MLYRTFFLSWAIRIQWEKLVLSIQPLIQANSSQCLPLCQNSRTLVSLPLVPLVPQRMGWKITGYITGIGLLSSYHVEKAMAPHSSTLAWKIPWTEEPRRLQSMRSVRVRHDERLHFHFSLSCTGEGNGSQLQYFCLENPRDGGAWWAVVYRITQSRTQLKRLSTRSKYATVLCRNK